MNNVGAIILAAGRGSRMKSTDTNKVTLPLGDKPMVRHAVDRLESMNFASIVIVVGFAKDSVIESLKGTKAIFADQDVPQGTGHALSCGLSKVPDSIEHVLVMNGDDSAFYSEEVLEKLVSSHLVSGADITLLTIEKDNPFGLGRIVRDNNDKLIDIIEEKNATDEQRLIKEVNPGCYIFRLSFLNDYKNKIQKNELTGEYYINNFIELAVKEGLSVEALKVSIPWRGVNTKEELVEAEKLYTQTKGV